MFLSKRYLLVLYCLIGCFFFIFIALLWINYHCIIYKASAWINLTLEFKHFTIAQMTHCILIDSEIYSFLLNIEQVNCCYRCYHHHRHHYGRKQNFLEIHLWIRLFGGPYAEAGTSIECKKGAQNFLWLRSLVIVFFRDYQPRISPHHLAKVGITLLFTKGQLCLHELMVFKTNAATFFVNSCLL